MLLDIITIVLSATALGFSLYVYIKHDKRIKPLELEIAKHTVKELREQEAAKEIADLDARSTYVRPGKLFVTITNHGQAIASNVNVEVLENASMFPLLTTGVLPYSSLPPTHPLELEYLTFEQSPNVIKIRVTWNDPSDSNKYKDFDLQVN